jgi:flagellar motor component MotA
LIRFPLVFDFPRHPARRQVRLHDAAHDATRARRPDHPACGSRGLEKVEVDDPFLAKAIRIIADGCDTTFIPDNLERDRDNTHLDERQTIYRAIGDGTPAFGMIGTLLGMV